MHRVCKYASFCTSETTCHTSHKQSCFSLLSQWNRLHIPTASVAWTLCEMMLHIREHFVYKAVLISTYMLVYRCDKNHAASEKHVCKCHLLPRQQRLSCWVDTISWNMGPPAVIHCTTVGCVNHCGILAWMLCLTDAVDDVCICDSKKKSYMCTFTLANFWFFCGCRCSTWNEAGYDLSLLPRKKALLTTPS